MSDLNNIKFDETTQMHMCGWCGKGFEKMTSCRTHVVRHHRKDMDETFGKNQCFNVTCCNCGKEIKKEGREKLFDWNKRYYCNASCRAKDFIKIYGVNFNNNIRYQKIQHREQTSKATSKVWSTQENVNFLPQSIGEIEIRTFLQKTYPNDEWTYGGCYKIGKYENEQGVYKCPDCHSNKLRVMLEYDGIFHFFDIFGTKKRFTNVTFKDALLNEWTQRNGWKLVRISDSFYQKDKENAKKLLVDAIYQQGERLCCLGSEYEQLGEKNG